MKLTPTTETVFAILLLFASRAMGQMTTTNLSTASPTNTTSATVTNEIEKQWLFSVSASTYIVPNGPEFVQPTITADHEQLHLELRYNYEALRTGSAWLGCNFSGGDKLAWEITPMVGGVFGDLTGVAPGYEATFNWWKLELYSEGEYVFDTGDSSNSFFYNWSELSLYPKEWFRFGLVTQRTRVYRTNRDIQRGLLVGFTWKKLDITTYVLNADASKPTVMVAVTYSF